MKLKSWQYVNTKTVQLTLSNKACYAQHSPTCLCHTVVMLNAESMLFLSQTNKQTKTKHGHSRLELTLQPCTHDRNIPERKDAHTKELCGTDSLWVTPPSTTSVEYSDIPLSPFRRFTPAPTIFLFFAFVCFETRSTDRRSGATLKAAARHWTEGQKEATAVMVLGSCYEGWWEEEGGGGLSKGPSRTNAGLHICTAKATGLKVLLYFLFFFFF